MITFAILCILIAHQAVLALEMTQSVHAFFYIWYGIPQFDGSYLHWDHSVLPHWESDINNIHPSIGSKHSPPGNLHSPFYPLEGPYSSKDPVHLSLQYSLMINAGIEVAIISWWGQPDHPHNTDTQGVTSDLVMHDILKAAEKNGIIKIAFHLEPYRSRTIQSIRDDLNYIIASYGNYTSLFRAEDGRLMFYVYDSYHIDIAQWDRLLEPSGDMTIRNTPLDSIFIGLWLEFHHGIALKNGGFDGVYTYFASDGFSFGSSTKNWHEMTDYCRDNDMICILSVGPGYEDTAIRPWNAHNSNPRRLEIRYISLCFLDHKF
jgi:glycoprotein endo-alpha-1,2-mannosidase